jgi:hypothetical protein
LYVPIFYANNFSDWKKDFYSLKSVSNPIME